MFEYRNEYRTEYLTAANVPMSKNLAIIFDRFYLKLVCQGNGDLTST